MGPVSGACVMGIGRHGVWRVGRQDVHNMALANRLLDWKRHATNRPAAGKLIS